MANRNTTAKPRIESSAEQTQAQQTEPKKAMIPKEVDPNQYVTVRNGFQGRLVYKSKRTGERFVWDSFGAEQDMELSELKMRVTPTRNTSSTTGSCLMSLG